MMRTVVLLLIVVAVIVPPYSSQAEDAFPVRIDFNQRVKMRDGVDLSADIYRPDAEGRFPVILSRTPYNKNGRRPLNFGKYFASFGYVYVEMDVRGRGDSDGIFMPYRNDGIDGYDAIEWCAKRPWSNGRVGTIGGSYLGRIQYLAAIHQPPHLVTMITMVTPSDPFVEFPTGLPIPMSISWNHFTAGRMNQNMDAVDWSAIHLHLPICTMDEVAGRPNPYWKEMIEHARMDDWWEPLCYQDKYDRVLVPVLHVSGWYDDEQIGTPLNFIGMTTKGKPEEIRKSQKLLMGPWPHGILKAERELGEIDFGPTAVIDLEGYFLRWFDYWLNEIDNGIMVEPPVRIFVMGENNWVDENEWPLARTKWTTYYLSSGGRANSLFGDGRLSTEKPAEEPPDGYMYDPADPVPFITDPEFKQIGGPDDYRPVERRDDVLVYTSPILEEDVTVCGPIHVKLYAASSAPDTDFMAKLLDVWPNGFAQRLTDSMVRARFRDGMDRPSTIEKGKIYLYDIDLWNTCQTIKNGHRIRLEITSSAFPKYDRNPNTGDELGKTTRTQIAHQTIYHDGVHPSHVILPIIPNE